MRNWSAERPPTPSPDDVSTLKYTATLLGLFCADFTGVSFSPPPSAPHPTSHGEARRQAESAHVRNAGSRFPRTPSVNARGERHEVERPAMFLCIPRAHTSRGSPCTRGRDEEPGSL